MTIEQINEGLRLEKEATPGPWFYDGICYLFSGTPHDAQMVADDRETIRMRGVGANLPLETNAGLIVFLRNHALELLECARRCVEMEKEIKRLSWFDPEMFHGEDGEGRCALCHGEEDQLCAACAAHEEHEEL